MAGPKGDDQGGAGAARQLSSVLGEGKRLTRTVALVGLMGSGKTAVGKRIAAAVGARFRDADDEIVRAAGMSIPEIFDRYGEEYFRGREQRVIARLLGDAPHVLATGGGAYMNAETRALLAERGFSIWLKADLDTLVARCGRRSGRPLLQAANPRKVLEELIELRYPIYAEADAVVETGNGPHETTVAAAIERMIESGALVGPEKAPEDQQGEAP